MTRIQHRRGTATQWTTANPVLAAGEEGFETDTGKMKIGDGVKTWSQLSYFLNEAGTDAKYALKGTGGSGSFSGSADDIVDGTTKVQMLKTERTKLTNVAANATANQTDAYLLNRANHTGTQAMTTVTGLDALNTDAARKSGSVKQFADVSDATPDDGDALIYDSTPSAYVPTDLSLRFAEKGADGKIAQADLPTFYVPAVILNDGDAVPANFPPSGLVLYKAAAATLSATLLKDGFGQGVTSLSLTIDTALAVGDTVGLAVVASNETATNVLAAFTAAFSAGSATVVWNGWTTQATTYAVVQGLLTVTAAVPAGSTLTITPRDASGVAIARPHLLASAFKLPNLAASPVDQVAVAGGASSSNMSVIGAASTVATAQAAEIVIGVAGFNAGIGTVTHTLSGTNGFTQISQLESDTGSGSRALFVAYKVLNGVVAPTFTTSMAASDGITGTWAADLVSYKGK